MHQKEKYILKVFTETIFQYSPHSSGYYTDRTYKYVDGVFSDAVSGSGMLRRSIPCASKGRHMPQQKAQSIDATKLFPLLQIPMFSIDQFAAAQRRNLDVASAITQ